MFVQKAGVILGEERHFSSQVFEAKEYLNFYKLEHIEHLHSYKMIGNQQGIFTQAFLPHKRKGLVLIVHGYLDHSGGSRELISELVNNDYGVVTFDLPGHGHSRGKRGDISNFSEYTEVLKKVLDHYRTSIEECRTTKFSVIAHSTGASIIVDYITTYKSNPFQKIILAAPLVRPYLWSFSKIGVKLIGKNMPYIRRKFRENSSNPDYLQFVRRDPLQFSLLPTNWLFSLEEWNNRIKAVKESEDTLFIIQGNKDKTVDWKFNVSFLLEKFPESNAILVDEGNHQLFNEKESVRDLTFYHIKRILDSGQ